MVLLLLMLLLMLLPSCSSPSSFGWNESTDEEEARIGNAHFSLDAIILREHLNAIVFLFLTDQSMIFRVLATRIAIAQRGTIISIIFFKWIFTSSRFDTCTIEDFNTSLFNQKVNESLVDSE